MDHRHRSLGDRLGHRHRRLALLRFDDGWGLAFWMAVAGVFELVAEKSRYPEERLGDAKAIERHIEVA